MITNFTAIDVIGTVEATTLMTFILFVPGYVIGWISNVFSFRRRPILFQCLLSTPLAISVLPILVYLLGRYRLVLWTVFAASWIAFPLVSRRYWSVWFRSKVRLSRHAWFALAFAAGWGAITIFTLVDLQIGKRLYFSVPAFDYSLRVSLTAASARAIPPVNPFFVGLHSFPLRYHYFWMMLCGLVANGAGIGARLAMYGGTVWAGIALMSAVGLTLKFFFQVRERFGRKLLIACGLLMVTGLDIIPTVLLYLGSHTVYPDMEWWNEQLTSWPDALLWCPHHVMSLVACITGFLLLREPGTSNMRRGALLVLAGACFASATGLSVLVSFTFSVFVLLWLPYAALRRWWGDVSHLLIAGTVALLLALPYLHSLLGPATDDASGGGRFFAVWIRPFPLGSILVGSLFHLRGPILGFLSIPFLPLNYCLELGFFAFVLVLRMNQVRKDSTPMTREEASAWIMVGTSFLIGTFLRSTTIQSNDLAWRCFLLAQFVLLMWGAIQIDEWWSRRASGITKIAGIRFAAVLLGLGVLGTLYQVCMLRVYPLLLDAGKVTPLQSATWMPPDHHLGERTFALRSIYDKLSSDLATGAVVQYNPEGNTYVPHGLYLLRDTAAGDTTCSAALGGDVSECNVRVNSIHPLFTNATVGENSRVDDVCREYRISVIIAEDNDPVWKQLDSWVWSRTPLLSNNYARAFDCGLGKTIESVAAR